MFEKIRTEYKKTKQPHEDFLEWFLIRKSGTAFKVVIAVVLWGLWLKYAFNLRVMVFFFEALFAGFILVLCGRVLLQIWKKMRKK